MFPPETQEDHRSAGRRSRTVGSRGRPLNLILAVVLLALFWIFAVGMSTWGIAHQRDSDNGAVFAMVFWTVVVALLLWRLWRGGRKAISAMSRLATGIGAVMLVGVVGIGIVFAVGVSDLPLSAMWRLVPGLLSAAALFTAGLLLRREDVRTWR